MRLNAIWQPKSANHNYREILLAISACWQSLACQDEAMDILLASWTPVQTSANERVRDAEQAA